ncbi:MAG: HEAT repeat domain-containing protein [Actinomycetota bacterium]|nr:HEAT repeat domain-containing protein [Actinomycetota bacterium]
MSGSGNSDFPGRGTTAEKLEMLLVPTDDPRARDEVRALDPAEALPVLADVLADQSRPSLIRRRAAMFMGVIGDRSAIPLLETAVGDRDEVVRARALQALATFGEVGASTARTVLDAARDEDPYVRETAARAVAALGLTEAPAILAEMAATDPAPEVRRAAGEAAKTLQGGGA